MWSSDVILISYYLINYRTNQIISLMETNLSLMTDAQKDLYYKKILAEVAET